MGTLYSRGRKETAIFGKHTQEKKECSANARKKVSVYWEKKGGNSAAKEKGLVAKRGETTPPHGAPSLLIRWGGTPEGRNSSV